LKSFGVCRVLRLSERLYCTYITPEWRRDVEDFKAAHKQLISLINAKCNTDQLTSVKNNLKEQGLLTKKFLQLYLDHLSSKGKLQALLEEVEGMDTPSLEAYSKIIQTCNKNNEWKAAEEYFERMKQEHLKPDALVYDEMMNLYAKQGFSDKCSQLFYEMSRDGFKPNENNFQDMMEAFGRNNDLVHGLKILSYVKKHNTITPTRMKRLFDVFVDHMDDKELAKTARKEFTELSRDYLKYIKAEEVKVNGDTTKMERLLKNIQDAGLVDKNAEKLLSVITYRCQSDKIDEKAKVLLFKSINFKIFDDEQTNKAIQLVVRHYVKNKKKNQALDIMEQLKEDFGLKLSHDVNNIFVTYMKTGRHRT